MAEIRCRFCGAEFASEKQLRRHYIETHRIERTSEAEPESGERGGAAEIRPDEILPGESDRSGGTRESDQSEGGRDASGASDISDISDLGERRLS